VKPRILFGLGNPGAEYANTPHNMGEAAVRAWAERAGLKFERGDGPFMITPVRREVRAVIPTTYMNVCGAAVSKLLAMTGFKPDDFLVVTDDVWLPLGRMRLRTGGSDGGHNGLKSVAEALGTENYPRLRLGVGPVPERTDWADFVLRPFSSAEQRTAAEQVTEAVEALNLIIARGARQAQNVINRAADQAEDDAAEKKAEN
jgi:PTH1 family peptidyl-tRNA hydrolase